MPKVTRTSLLTSSFRVSPHDIPERITFRLSEMERCMFADLLTLFGFGVDVAGDSFHHLYRRGLEKVYQEYFEEV
jgi:hypothetical protein